MRVSRVQTIHKAHQMPTLQVWPTPAASEAQPSLGASGGRRPDLRSPLERDDVAPRDWPAW